MKENNEQIHIHHDFIESNTSTFIELYDISLVRYMMHYKSMHFDDLQYNIEPQQIVEIEKKFIQRTIDFLKHRRGVIKAKQEKIFLQFLKNNNLTREEFNKSGIDIENRYIEFNEDQLSKVENDEDIAFTIKMNFLLVKANKIGCLIDLKEDFKFDEPVDYNTEEEEIFKNISGPEKLVYLKELGVLEFLETKYPDISQAGKAKVLSIIMGVKNIRPTLQAMESDHFGNNPKNPYNNKKTATIVKDHLIQWGFKIDTKENK